MEESVSPELAQAPESSLDLLDASSQGTCSLDCCTYWELTLLICSVLVDI